jgi:dTDP-4-dehydrorhamnose reductase
MTRWLITGGTGMVATDLRAALHDRGVEVVAPGKADLDITDFAAVKRIVDEQQPSVIINCAAYTKVDAAEANENLATAINGSAVEFLAKAAGDALLVQISTDFVFDGTKRTP